MIKPAVEQTKPLFLNDHDLTGLYISADMHAGEAQNRYLRSVCLYIVALVGVALAQMLASIHNDIAALLDIQTVLLPDGWTWERIWYFVLAMFVIITLSIRLLHHWFTPKHWVHSRELAEAAKRLSWYYAMGLKPDGTPCSAGENVQAMLQQTLHDLRVKHLANILPNDNEGPIITETMERLRTEPVDVRLQAYMTGRLEEQIRWYRLKIIWNKKRVKIFEYCKNVAEFVAFIGALLLAAYFRNTSKWTVLMYPGLSTYAAILAWVNHKRFNKVAETYSRAADALESLLIEMRMDGQNGLDEIRLADQIHRCENIMDQEHDRWVFDGLVKN